jgi:hypothetical protein
MGMFCQRWLVLYETKKGSSEKPENAAKIIVDSDYVLPHGVLEEDIADDCYRIVAFVALPDDYEPHCVVMDDRAVEVQLPPSIEDE